MAFTLTQRADSLGSLFLGLRPRLEETLRRYEIPPEDAGGLIEQTILELIYKGGDSDDPAAWLIARVRKQCRGYWVARRRLVTEAVGRVFAER
jgi:hypothetical protein